MTLFRRARHSLPRAVRGVFWRLANPLITVWKQDQSIRQRKNLNPYTRVAYRLLENVSSVIEGFWLLALMLIALVGLGIPFCIHWTAREICNTWVD